VVRDAEPEEGGVGDFSAFELVADGGAVPVLGFAPTIGFEHGLDDAVDHCKHVVGFAGSVYVKSPVVACALIVVGTLVIV
jgi:hypothetical protein